MKVLLSVDRQVRRNLLALFAAGLLFWASLASLLPTLPLYIEDIGATKQQIGVIMGSFAIGLLIFRPFLGQIADKRGRKIVLIIGIISAAIAPMGYNFVQSIPLLMVIRAFHGISIAAFSTGFLALVADIAPVENRGELIGYMSLVNPVGLAIGPALGGYLMEAAGYTSLFILSTVLACLALLCTIPIINPIVPVEEQVVDNDSPFWKKLISPRVRIPAFILLIIGLILGSLHTFVPLFIKSTEAELNPGLFYTVVAIASFCSRLFCGRASDRFGRGLFITLSLVCYSLALLLLWTANSSEDFLFAAIIEGIGGGTIIPMIAAMITDRAYPQERGRIFSLCMVGFDIGVALAGPIFGLVAQQIGYRNIFGFNFAIALISVIIFMTLSSKNLPASLRFAFGRGVDIYSLNKVGVRS
ncbi:MAG: MFS transporter [Richelia sp. RM2_1_2]|nr:MFS transporter [Richelia sp. SM1_7_0]NJN09071.1 MFS transporter [Richelia sp. RM1_1_1]NJO26831.1 MFS transporter [Richelia sp. SL_2_1]NJO58604.1 MFS transporter [Richelia sp. RM2_1_2]